MAIHNLLYQNCDKYCNKFYKRSSIIFFILYLFLLPTLVLSTPQYNFKNPIQQQQFHELITTTRCLVCQNENIASSNAPLAIELRRTIYTMLQQGKTPATIQDYLSSRYGDFILFKPPLQPNTYLLWFAPAVFLLIGLLIAWRIIKLQKLKTR